MPRLMLPRFILVAAVAITGCGAAGEAPVEPASAAAAAPVKSEAAPTRVEAAAPTPAEAATAMPIMKNEIPAPESSKIVTPLSSEDASQLMSKYEAQKAEREATTFCPGCAILHEPDLTVVEDDRNQIVWDPNYGWVSAEAKGFDVENIGHWQSGAFQVLVLQGADSYSFEVPGLNAGQSIYYQITNPTNLGPPCGPPGPAQVLVNPFETTFESNYNNNSVTINGYCLL